MGNVVAIRKQEDEPEHGGPDGPEISVAICPDCEGTVFTVILRGDDLDYLECDKCRAWVTLHD